MRFSAAAVYDLETTGYSPKKDQIIDLSVILWSPSQEPQIWSTLIKPTCPIPERITQLTGLQKASFLPELCTPIDEVLARLEALAGAQDVLMVAHNGNSFDSKFLASMGFKIPARRQWDTMLQMRAAVSRKATSNWRKCQENAKFYRTKQKVNLLEAAKYYGVATDPDEMHRAEADAKTCLGIFKKQIVCYKTLFSLKEQQ